MVRSVDKRSFTTWFFKDFIAAHLVLQGSVRRFLPTSADKAAEYRAHDTKRGLLERSYIKKKRY